MNSWSSHSRLFALQHLNERLSHLFSQLISDANLAEIQSALDLSEREVFRFVVMPVDLPLCDLARFASHFGGRNLDRLIEQIDGTATG